MASIKEIAKQSGVSIATVSNVINDKPGVGEDTKKRVLETIKLLDYTPNVIAKNLKQKNSKTIGIITEDLTVFNTAEIVDGINEYCEEHDYQFVLGNLRLYRKYDKTFYTENNYYSNVIEEFKMMRSKRVEGIIYVGCHCREIMCIPDNFKIPIVTAYSYSSNDEIPSVIFDDEQGAYEITCKLINSGHRNIGLICGLDKSMHTNQRLIGYQRALFDNKILYNPKLVYSGDWERKSGYEGSKRLLGLGVTAIFAMNDVMAGGVYDYINELELKIGKDIALVGFDNQQVSEAYTPALTTVALPLSKIGKKSAEVLIEMIQNPQVILSDKTYKIYCDLKERYSINTIEV
ncbi:LacI family DNA-binding transcriptional regulator [Clostridium manihotivorum]|uniref:LacI family transcriptional regulator n=1 Tax=Clostridium manihotivorum TaxID=2320868 RepID=A0A410DU23_9CLOT|nr:LacI family DNA-binding transcriptional regulator [Clostridium manihotivorum]QAA32624.1 LacI family transcriptional regulator [Clostridium manihotivorum]